MMLKNCALKESLLILKPPNIIPEELPPCEPPPLVCRLDQEYQQSSNDDTMYSCKSLEESSGLGDTCIEAPTQEGIPVSKILTQSYSPSDQHDLPGLENLESDSDDDSVMEA